MSDEVTLKIPRELYDKIKELIEDTGFNSVTEFSKFVLRDVVVQGEFERSEELDAGMKKVRDRLRKLGYIK